MSVAAMSGGDTIGGPERCAHAGGARLLADRDVYEAGDFAGGREITLGDLGAKQGILGGINAVIVGNYLTTLGRPAEADLELLDDLQMPIKALNASL